MDKNKIIKINEFKNKIVGSTIEKSSLIIKLIYEIKEAKYINLLGDNF